MAFVFTDRTDAGRRLAAAGDHLRNEDTVVLGLPRGGVVVAAEVAETFQAPLDVIVVRKLGAPFQPELALGAIGEDGIRVMNERIVVHAHVRPEQLQEVEERERTELHRRVERYRQGRPRVPLEGRTALLVDDGIATGATARAACRVARALGARRVVVAVPVASPEAVEMLRPECDEVVTVQTPPLLSSIGEWYEDFTQTSDEEVVELLSRATGRGRGPGREDASHVPAPRPAPAADAGRRVPGPHYARDDEIEVRTGGGSLTGHLTLPVQPVGVVVFAHGSGSSRHSSRNRQVAEQLQQQAGMATLLFDLLSEAEEAVDRIYRHLRFNIELLATRLTATVDWATEQSELVGFKIGLFGASTGAGAALRTAADRPDAVGAVVSRGGRPDLALDALPRVNAPTLLIVGAHDEPVIELNEQARNQMHAPCELKIVPGASHLFVEPGTLEQVAELASSWFAKHLKR